jgi:hypothetical protein
MPKPIPSEPDFVDIISKKFDDPLEPPYEDGTPRTRSTSGPRHNMKLLPASVRRSLCADILAGMPYKQVEQEYGIQKKTYYRYRQLLADYAHDLFTSRTEGRKRQIERDIQWTLGVARSGVEMAQAAREPVLNKNGEVVYKKNPETGEKEIVYSEKPDTRAMSMFLNDAHQAIDRWGDLHELTGKGADRRNARRMQREELDLREKLQTQQIEANKGFGMNGNGPLQVFVIPKLPGVEQYPALPAKSESPPASSSAVVDAEFSNEDDQP